MHPLNFSQAKFVNDEEKIMKKSFCEPTSKNGFKCDDYNVVAHERKTIEHDKTLYPALMVSN